MFASRLVSACLLAWFTVVALGVPLPAPRRAAPGAAGERFPCENCPCGCGTAEHCWQDCCCHTLPERLAWAEREGVRPPDSALAEARAAGLEIAHWAASRTAALGGKSPIRPQSPPEDRVAGDGAQRSPQCAASGSASAGGFRRSSPATPLEIRVPARSGKPGCCCCSAGKGSCAPAEAKPQRSDRSPGVNVLQSLACRGMHAQWLALGAVTLTAPFELTITLPASDLCSPLLPPAISPAFAVPTPPPRTLV
ncbi:MAG: hypothetical protein KDA44_17010 [Planctomycetales bacterium]|nr:hypothetical protein [Planctomycetales bacterium]